MQIWNSWYYFKMVQKLLVRTLPVCVSGCIFFLIKKIECGVSQGSILGPILSSLYIDGLQRASSIQQFHIYADDTSILCRDCDLNSLANIVNQGIPKITEWFASNKLSHGPISILPSFSKIFEKNICKSVIIIFAMT